MCGGGGGVCVCVGGGGGGLRERGLEGGCPDCSVMKFCILSQKWMLCNFPKEIAQKQVTFQKLTNGNHYCMK